MEQIRFPKSDGATDPYNSTAGRRGRSEEVSQASADAARHGSPTSAPWKLEASRSAPRTGRAGQSRISHRLPEGPDVDAGAFCLPASTSFSRIGARGANHRFSRARARRLTIPDACTASARPRAILRIVDRVIRHSTRTLLASCSLSIGPVRILIELENQRCDGDFGCQNRNCLLISPMDRTQATESRRYRSRGSVRGWSARIEMKEKFGPTHRRAEISVTWGLAGSETLI